MNMAIDLIQALLSLLEPINGANQRENNNNNKVLKVSTLTSFDAPGWVVFLIMCEGYKSSTVALP